MPSTPRWSLPYPASTDPPAGHTELQALALALDDVAKDDQGTLANRPVSTSGSPGKKGRYYMVRGDSTVANNGILWRDNGTGWDPVGQPVPPGHQWDSQEITTTQTVAGTLTDLAVFAPVTFDGGPVYVELAHPVLRDQGASFWVYEGGSQLTDVRVVLAGACLFLRFPLTPTAAAHTYKISWQAVGGGTAKLDGANDGHLLARIVKV